jgi:hypothetical protein
MSKSQQISPDNLVDCLFSTFGMSAIHEFRKFLAKHPMVNKWMVASDFVINESQATQDAYAYTFFPYNAEIHDIKKTIRELVPRDFKETKTVPTKLQEFLHSGQGVVADNPHVITLLLQDTENGIGVSRLLCSKSPLPSGPRPCLNS